MGFRAKQLFSFSSGKNMKSIFTLFVGAMLFVAVAAYVDFSFVPYAY
jgi:hypothetical protein